MSFGERLGAAGAFQAAAGGRRATPHAADGRGRPSPAARRPDPARPTPRNPPPGSYVLYWLVRAGPAHMLRLQSGRFDAPDRLFASVAEAWGSAATGPNDVKELVPEFYMPGGPGGSRGAGRRQGDARRRALSGAGWCALAQRGAAQLAPSCAVPDPSEPLPDSARPKPAPIPPKTAAHAHQL